jgi:O-antigen ligase
VSKHQRAGRIDVSKLPDRVSSYIFFFMIAVAPLPLGSRDAGTVVFWCVLASIGLLMASTRLLRRSHVWLIAGIGLIVAGYLFVLHEQLASAPWIAKFNPVWSKAAEALQQPIAPSVAVVRDEPYYALGAPLVAILTLLLGLIVGADRSRSRKALMVLAWSGVGYAVYGILSLVFEPGMILWHEKTAYFGNLTGTFINRNTAATYFGSCAAVWFVLFMEIVRGRLPRGPIEWDKAAGHLLTDTPRELMLRFAMFFICLAALLMTASRGGVLVSLAVMVVSFAIYFRQDLSRGRTLLVALLAAAAIAVLLLQLLGGNVGARIDEQGLTDASRMEGWKSSLRLIADNPWFGTGLGAFAWAFPAYRSSNILMWGVWDRAHSTPLEIAAELGIPLAALIGFAWLVALVILVRPLAGSRRNFTLPLSALAVALIANVHSAVDFSLQVSGYAIVVFALLGVGLSQALAGNEDREAEPHVRYVKVRRKPHRETDEEAETGRASSG